MLGARNRIGLTERQIRHCMETWDVLCDIPKPLDVSQAARHGSRTRYDQDRNLVILGADAFQGPGATANARMSMMACLAHELAHALRAEMGFDRPFAAPDAYLDEAETSIFASFLSNMNVRDREDLVEDARDRVTDWLAQHGRET